jgi:hypothetical protein
MQTRQNESKQKRQSSKFVHAVVVILAIVFGVGALEVGAKILGSLATAAAEHTDVARPDLWSVTQSKLHN